MGRFSNKEKAAEARREIAQRLRVYPRRVAEGKMHADAASRQTALMEEIAADYEAKDREDRPDLFGDTARQLNQALGQSLVPIAADVAARLRAMTRVGMTPGRVETCRQAAALLETLTNQNQTDKRGPTP